MRPSWLRSLANQLKSPFAKRRPFRKHSAPVRPMLETLETRVLPATFTVVNTNDAGAGSLRQAILDANAMFGADNIAFNIAGTGVKTIAPVTALPFIGGEGLTLDATTQPGFAVGAPLIELRGDSAGPNVHGFDLFSPNVTIKGFVINRFNGLAIRVLTNGPTVIVGNYIGTNATGSAAVGGGGIQVFASSGVTIGGSTAAERNVISTGISAAVAISISNSASNVTIRGNYIGTNATATTALGNFDGVTVSSSTNITIEGNVISSSFSGVSLTGASTTNVMVRGNFIGTNGDGTAALTNSVYGVRMEGGANNNTIGGAVGSARNVISGNTLHGVFISGNTTTSNLIQGNHIGTNTAGTAAVPNGSRGVYLLDAPGNTIGGIAVGAGNLISGNAQAGVTFDNSNNNFMQGNTIGTNLDGTMALANGGRGGVQFTRTATGNLLGGTAAGASNLISGNAFGVYIEDGSANNRLEGNSIGTNRAGTGSIANTGDGVRIESNASLNVIGGTPVGTRNIISGNGINGVRITGGATGNTVEGNYIGTNPAGTLRLANGSDGVRIDNGATNNTIGGLVIEARNVISGNLTGVRINDSNTTNNRVQGNYIGLGSNGSSDLGNTGDGVVVAAGSGNTIGGATAGARNVISGNDGYGLLILSPSTGTLVQSNYIGTNAAGLTAVGNNIGASIQDAPNNTLRGNVISGNSGSNGQGVVISGPANGSVLAGNLIGLNAAGDTALPNADLGILLQATSNITIGGMTAADRNIISGNAGAGVHITLGATGIVVLGNYIGTDINGTLDRGNVNDGILIDGGANNNTIGGTAAGARNVISGNNGSGVFITGLGSAGNQVQGNFIGTNAAGTSDLGNAAAGIFISGGATGNLVGGTTAGARNVISGNDNFGVTVQSANNTVQGNYIGTNAAGTAALGNTGSSGFGGAGVFTSDASTIIGGTAAGAGNLISGNAGPGVWVRYNTSAGTVVQGSLIGTNAAGAATLSGQTIGVLLTDGATGVSVGGTTAGARNVVSGHSQSGVNLLASSTNNTIQGNYIGTDVTGTLDRGNAGDGVRVESGASNNTIGGTTAGARNVISGNDTSGIEINDSTSTGNVVAGNYIGTDVTGNGLLANSRKGIDITGARNNIIGGATAGAGNVISGNLQDGIVISGATASSNVVAGNFIGTNAVGNVALANGHNGIYIHTAASGNTIGGTTALARNVISGNSPSLIGGGIRIEGSGTTGNLVQGNYIGTNAAGTAALPNGLDGVDIGLGASNNTIGGTVPGARNVISGNDSEGIDIGGTGTTGNLVQGNYIGTNSAGTAALGNGVHGVRIYSGATGNTIGGLVVEARNVISGNSQHGIYIIDPGTSGNVVLGNFIGTNAAGTAALGNGTVVAGSGVQIAVGASNNTIGGTVPGSRNVISGNSFGGIVLFNPTTTGNIIRGNYIGTNDAGTAAIPNQEAGVAVNGAVNTQIGGTAAGAGNLISGNAELGVELLSTTSNVVQGNLIGTNALGTAALPNASHGVKIASNSSNNTIGGTTPGAENVIAFNGGAGVVVDSGPPASVGNAIRRNSIHSNAALGIDLANNGVTLNDLNDVDSGPNGLFNFPVLKDAIVLGGTLTIAGFARPGTEIELFVAASDPTGFGQGRTFLATLTEGSAADTDATTGTYGPAPVSGDIPVGRDSTNHFRFAIPLPTGLTFSTTLTATGTLSGNTSEFSATILLTSAGVSVVVDQASISEGDAVTLTGSLRVPDPSRPQTVIIDWRDGFTETLNLVPNSIGFTTTHRYLDDNPSGTAADTYMVQVTVNDPLGTLVNSASVTVNNVAPDARIISEAVDATGGQVSLRADVFDPGPLAEFNALTYQWTVLVNGTVVGSSTLPVFTFTRPSTTQRSEVRLIVSDDDTGMDTDLAAVITYTPGGDSASLTNADAGTAGRIVAYALAGNDTVDASGATLPVELVGGPGNDTLTGGSNDDRLVNDANNDTLQGRAGNDTYLLIPSSAIVITELVGGSDAGGRDTVNFSRAPTAITYNLSVVGQAQTVSTGNTVTASGIIENLTGSNFDDTLTGSPGDNLLVGGLGRDTINGGDGADTIFGETGTEADTDTQPGAGAPDSIVGGMGNDSINGGQGDDYILGDNDTAGGAGGNDRIFGGLGSDTIYGGRGNDNLWGGTDRSEVTIPGTIRGDFLVADDILAGIDGENVIRGTFRDDTIVGGSSDDIIYADTGNDRVEAGGGADTIFGDLGNDTLYGEDGNDLIFGDTATGTMGPDGGNDSIYGGAGNDRVSGGPGDDRIFGESDTPGDTLPGGGADDLRGGLGADTIDGGSGDDFLLGDTFTHADGGGNDSLLGGRGSDTIEGGPGNDTLYGDTNNSVADALGGTVNRDYLLGNAGADNLHGGSWDDTLDGGLGVDSYFGDEGRFDMLVTGADATLILALTTITIGTEVEPISGIEHAVLMGGDGNNLLDARNFGSPVTLMGGGGNDTLQGSSFDDELNGGAGNDSLEGGGGNDRYLFVGSGLGNDLVTEVSGGGVDTLDFLGFGRPVAMIEQSVVVNLSLTTTQIIRPSQPTQLSLTLSSGTDVENVVGSPYDDRIMGNSVSNQLIGAGGRDSILGGGGNDSLQGGITQVVYLDFDTFTTPGQYQYTLAERDAIRARLAADVDPFTIEFTHARPSGGRFATLFFNRSLVAVGQELAGFADEIDPRNLNLGSTAAIDVNGPLIAGRTSAQVVAISANVAGHELGHLLGLRHWDALGPIGTGIFSSLDPGVFSPAYPGPTTATATPMHLMTSPGSLNVSQESAFGDLILGPREAIKLAFADTGKVIAEQTNPHRSRDMAQMIALHPLAIQDSLIAGAVQAVAVVGTIGLDSGQSESDFYSFSGSAGQKVTLEISSATLNRANDRIDSILRVYRDVGGTPVSYYGIDAVNDDALQGTDSILIDLILFDTGTYYIEVTAFDDLNPTTDPDVGDYELFLYSVAPGGNTGPGDTLRGEAGDDVLIGSSGNDLLDGGTENDTFLFDNHSAGIDNINGGAGTDALDFRARAVFIAPNFSDTTPQHVGGGYQVILSGVEPPPLSGPSSRVAALPEQTIGTHVPVSWIGEGAGITGFDVYVSDNNGSFTLWQSNTLLTQALYTTGQFGHSYTFYSVARVGSQTEPIPSTPDAQTTLFNGTLRVVTTALTPSGVVVQFNYALDAAVLNLFDTQTAGLGPADVTLVGANTGPVQGSLLVDAMGGRVTFLRTGGGLAADTYTLTLRSAANGFKSATGLLLDGNADGIPGDNSATQLVVAPSSARTVSVPDFMRGPGQAVNVPAGGSGLPLSLSDGAGVTSVTLTLLYNPTLLTISGATIGSGLPAGANVSLNTATPGQAVLTFTSPTALAAGPVTFARLTATIPNTAPYTAKQLLDLADVRINNGAIAAREDDGVHIVGYFGDTTANAAYSAADASRVQRVGVGLDSGFAAYQLADPVVIADITGNGTLNSTDANRILQEVIGLDRPEIPALPGVIPPIVPGGPDPYLNFHTHFVGEAGDQVTVPLLLDLSDGLESADLAISFDARRLKVVEVRRGSLTYDFDLFAAHVDNESGALRLALSRLVGAIDGRGSGSVIEIVFRIREDAPAGPTVINLRRELGLVTTQLNEGGLDLIPDPSDDEGDALDGLLTILGMAETAKVSLAHEAPVRAEVVQNLRAIDRHFAGLAEALAAKRRVQRL